MQTNNTTTTLVLGGTGKTGSRVASRLQQLGRPVRIGSRSAETPFYWENQSSWETVLQDIDAVYITFQPDLAMPGAVDMIRSFTALAVEKGVKKLVLLSGRGEPEAQACEEIIIHLGIEWTIVRASWFCQNFSESHMLDPILAGHVSLPVDEVGEPFVDADDIADIVLAALTAEGHDGEIYEVTGPRLITFQDAVAEIASISGRPIQFSRISNDEYEAMLTIHGVPKELVSLLIYLFNEVLDGRNASITNGVERALGRKATDFSEYVRKTATTGVWNQSIVHS